MRIFFVILFALFTPAALMAQKKGPQKNEGDVPRVSIYGISKDSLRLLTTLQKSKENRIKVVLEGGMERIKSEVYVTSKNAEIRKSPSSPNEYIVVPLEEECEIIVDVKTFEAYYAVKETDKKGRKVKEIVKEYPPKTYMVSYERYVVK